jgi:hypothetical protein
MCFAMTSFLSLFLTGHARTERPPWRVALSRIISFGGAAQGA